MLAVQGASGCGKSTFLHLVGAMEKPDAGEITIDGINVTQLDAEHRARFRNSKIGFVFQFHHLLPEFTALENVMMPLLLRRFSRREAARKASRFLGEVGLSDRQHHRPGELSGGEQQRVAVARALVGEPSLLLADEPTGNLDDRTSDSIHALLLEIHGRNLLTSILVTHDSRLAQLCEQRMKLENGRLSPLDPGEPRTL
jgi:lipoprotein-releasing system ATP-binding protein